MDENKIIKLYNSKVVTTKIAEQLNISLRSVYRILENNNITLHKDKECDKTCSICESKLISKRRNRCGTCNTNIRRYRLKNKAVNYLGGECKCCSWTGDISGFDFHHLEPNEKVFNLNARNIANFNWSIIEKELNKCILLCALCHRLEHSNYSNERFIKEAKK